MPRSKGRAGRPWRRTCQRLRKPGAICYLCRRPIDIDLQFPHRWSFTVHHIDGNKDNNDPTNHAPAHLRCNCRDGALRVRRKPRNPTSRRW